MMILKFGLLVLTCIATASDAAVLSRELDKRQNDEPVITDWEEEWNDWKEAPEEPYIDAVNAEDEPYFMDEHLKNSLDPIDEALHSHRDAIEYGLESVFFGAKGFRDNMQAFVGVLGQVLEEFYGNYIEAMLPVLEAIPAEVLKEGVINVSKAASSLIEKLAVVLPERNPLHPQKSPYELSNMIGRELDELKRKFVGTEIMTLSVWGENVGKMIGAMDNLLVDLVAALAEKMKGVDAHLQASIEQLETIPASMLKDTMVQTLRRHIRRG